MNLREYIGSLCVIMVMFIANSGGLGGGGVIIPTVVVFYFFGIKNSIALSNTSVAFSGIVRYFMNLNEPHPLKNGKGVLVDYDYPLIMLPAIIVGSSIGVIVNDILPEVVIVSVLTFLLFNMSIMTILKLIKICKAENKAKKL